MERLLTKRKIIFKQTYKAQKKIKFFNHGKIVDQKGDYFKQTYQAQKKIKSITEIIFHIKNESLKTKHGNPLETGF